MTHTERMTETGHHLLSVFILHNARITGKPEKVRQKTNI